MKKVSFSIIIQAPQHKVWATMFDDSKYREWTKAFNPGSYFKGDWSQGSTMLFLGPDPNGDGEGGIVSRIKENKPYELMSIEHLAIFKDGLEDRDSPEAQKWFGALENYRFKEQQGGTEVYVELDIVPEYEDMFATMWPDALNRLKTLAEE